MLTDLLMERFGPLSWSMGSRLAAVSNEGELRRLALVHGDVSPKNILCGPRGPVLLDAECAWYGDPAFDPAFCLNHLLLKCLWTPRATAGFLACFDALAAAYLEGVAWEAPAAIEARAARLLPGLRDAAADHLTDGHRVETGPLQNAGLDASEQGGGVHLGELSVALADGRTAGFDDDGIAHDRVPLSSWEWGVGCSWISGRRVAPGGS